jgi:Glyoxalase/Bleomycin resistance protein/Dioxygenase superfamily
VVRAGGRRRLTEPTGLRSKARAGQHPGIRHIASAVEDTDAVVAGLRAHGAELVGELERYDDTKNA